jgi:metallopeptidase MepB
MQTRLHEILYTNEMFKLAQVVMRRGEQVDDEEAGRFLRAIYKSFVHEGLMLADLAKRDRLRVIAREIEELRVKFKDNIANVNRNRGLWFTPEELEGLSVKTISECPKGSGENEGQIFLGRVNICQWKAKSATTRKRALIHSYAKYKDNAPVFRDIIMLRDEAAQLLGYKSHATLRMEDMMARGPESIVQFMDSVQARLNPISEKYISQLKEIKRRDVEGRGEPFDGHFYLWDWQYYQAVGREQQGKMPSDKISEYFPLEGVINTMMEMFRQVFGVAFTELDPEERAKLSSSGDGGGLVWHDTVRLFAARDTDGDQEFLGYLYLDLFERDDKKAGDAAFHVRPVR